jgi:Uma2 family endonuclease
MATLTKEVFSEAENDLSEADEFLLEQLKHVEGKAEIVNGRIELMPPTGEEPGLSGFQIALSLNDHARRTGQGRVVPDNVGFRVNLQNRLSFSPDVAFINRARSGNAGFIEGAPVFAVEVRSEHDFGPHREREISQKRADYFTAGTLVVWDVDPFGADVIKKYSATNPDEPQIFRRGDVADAEPAVPGWRMRVDEIFE